MDTIIKKKKQLLNANITLETGKIWANGKVNNKQLCKDALLHYNLYLLFEVWTFSPTGKLGYLLLKVRIPINYSITSKLVVKKIWLYILLLYNNAT